MGFLSSWNALQYLGNTSDKIKNSIGKWLLSSKYKDLFKQEETANKPKDNILVKDDKAKPPVVTPSDKSQGEPKQDITGDSHKFLVSKDTEPPTAGSLKGYSTSENEQNIQEGIAQDKTISQDMLNNITKNVKDNVLNSTTFVPNLPKPEPKKDETLNNIIQNAPTPTTPTTTKDELNLYDVNAVDKYNQELYDNKLRQFIAYASRFGNEGVPFINLALQDYAMRKKTPKTAPTYSKDEIVNIDGNAYQMKFLPSVGFTPVPLLKADGTKMKYTEVDPKYMKPYDPKRIQITEGENGNAILFDKSSLEQVDTGIPLKNFDYEYWLKVIKEQNDTEIDRAKLELMASRMRGNGYSNKGNNGVNVNSNDYDPTKTSNNIMVFDPKGNQVTVTGASSQEAKEYLAMLRSDKPEVRNVAYHWLKNSGYDIQNLDDRKAIWHNPDPKFDEWKRNNIKFDQEKTRILQKPPEETEQSEEKEGLYKNKWNTPYWKTNKKETKIE